MSYRPTTLLTSIFACAFLLSACATSSQRLDQDLSVWQNIYDYGEITQEDDELLLISTGNWFLLSKQQYENFVFEAEVKMPDTKEYSNSGIIFRAQVGKHETRGAYAYGYQAEVDPSERKWSGGLYEQGTRRQWLHPLHDTRSFPDEDFKVNHSPIWDDTKANAYKHLSWNKYKIKAEGNDIKIWVNDVLTTHVTDTKLSKGFVGIQHHGSHGFAKNGDRSNTIRFRNIKITSL
ncbi:3-keto-disaccharide hydrolase [Agaribacter marinus]|uniref:3-keto-alpha-glucoside-1,2-lyase/3-keto-2-hydroxy-glucal hydratase domain-containing protein n=1 Tax=Agaribacter marinus TaxID=1431249 RepID=A0AA37T4W4_9ALTE|nr:DUF1080 domain-containing protein [Agaribacter marinus]GLR72158.1 hypothetical protein GCM10007852_30660 [Agaribacter marinus]